MAPGEVLIWFWTEGEEAGEASGETANPVPSPGQPPDRPRLALPGLHFFHDSTERDAPLRLGLNSLMSSSAEIPQPAV